MADDKKQTGETTKPQPKPAKRRTNKRLELAKAVQAEITGYGNTIGEAQSSSELFDLTFKLGIAVGRAKEGSVDDMTVQFAEDLARQHMAKALAKITDIARGHGGTAE